MIYRALIGTLILMAGTAGAAEQWWEPSQETLPHLVAEGYTVAGFAMNNESNAVMHLVAYRYILQKDASVYLCTEKAIVNGTETAVSACYRLKGGNTASP